MSRKSLLEAALGLCTVGGAVFAVGASKDPVSKVVILPDAAFGILMVVGGVLAAAGAIAFMLSFLIDRLEQAVSQVAYGDLDSKYLCTQARPSDLPELVGETVQVTGIPENSSGAEFLYKKGKDNILRFSPTQATLVFFTQNQLVAYSCAFDCTTGKPLNESTDEYFYRDVVSVSTKAESVSLNLGKEFGTVQATAAESFTLTTSGATKIRVVLKDASLVQKMGGGDLPTTRADAAVQSVRRMLRDKKAANV